MRSPVIAFSILAAAVSPTLVAGAPTSPNPDTSVRHSPRQFNNMAAPLKDFTPSTGNSPATNGLSTVVSLVTGARPNNGDNNNGHTQPSPDGRRNAEEQLHNPSSSSVNAYTSHRKRASDMNTAGGNSYTGAAGDTSGGDAVGVSHGGDFGGDEDVGDGVDNVGTVTGGAGGDGYSGFSYGGDGDGKGAGGNSYSGSVGPSVGGDVINASQDGGEVENEDTVTGGVGGFDETGDATGGDAAGNVVDGVNTDDYSRRRKRGMDSGTAGGNAYTGASSDVDGGNVINHTEDEDGETINEEAVTGGAAGDTYSGEANGGDGDGYGPGGNAYSGATGSAVGGSVVSTGEFVENEGDVAGGAGGESESGDAEGGDA